MDDRIKQAFGQIHAEEELKTATKEYISGRYAKKHASGSMFYKRLLPAAACVVFAVTGLSGCKMYFTTTSVISIDINPSLELNVNRFDRIISCRGLNEDGTEIADSVHLRFRTYTDALNMLLEEDRMQEYLSDDGELSIVVVGDDEVQSEEMVTQIETCTSGMQNTYCCAASQEDVTEAHDHGLSYGKYKAFLELQEENPDITAEDIQDMTMKEIHDMLHGSESDSDDIPEETDDTGCPEQHGNHDGGNGEEHRRGAADSGKH